MGGNKGTILIKGTVPLHGLGVYGPLGGAVIFYKIGGRAYTGYNATRQFLLETREPERDREIEK